MPKDPSKQGHRGIGFVTYATPESVEAVMQVHLAAMLCLAEGRSLAVPRCSRYT